MRYDLEMDTESNQRKLRHPGARYLTTSYIHAGMPFLWRRGGMKPIKCFLYWRANVVYTASLRAQRRALYSTDEIARESFRKFAIQLAERSRDYEERARRSRI